MNLCSFSHILVESLKDALTVTKILKLKAVRDHLEETRFNRLLRPSSSSSSSSWSSLSESSIEKLNVAREFEFHPFINSVLVRKIPLQHLSLLNKSSFKEMDRELRFEILKNTIKRKLEKRRRNEYDSQCNLELLELQIIFNFLDLILYESRNVEIVPKKIGIPPSPYNTKSLEESGVGKFIPYGKDLTDCVTLIVEEQEIYVNSCVLTNNSPVFKAMLMSTSFKEGQSKRINLPGKKFSEISFFLRFLQAPQEIGVILGKPSGVWH